MKHFRWLKQQDFCLRLGLLKVLVAGLHIGGFGRSRDRIVSRVAETLFAPATALMAEVANAILGEPADSQLTRSDVLLLSSQSASWGQPIKPQTAGKILEWAQGCGFVAPGYRLTDRGRLWLTFMDEQQVSRFFSTHDSDWNPYNFSVSERAFLCYHLGEADELLWQLAFDLGDLPVGKILEARETYTLTLNGLKTVLERSEGKLPLPELPRFRAARELAETIAVELGADGGAIASSRAAFRGPRNTGRMRCSQKRKSCKNADHQAIPRFEQLVDLGFLTKRITSGLTGEKLKRARAAWSFEVTPAASKLRSLVSYSDLQNPEWFWQRFANAFSSTLSCGECRFRDSTLKESVGLFVEAYDRIHRLVGQTPFESVALRASAVGLEQGLLVEIKPLHDLMLVLKRSDRLQGYISFAAGNEVDRMFVMLRPGFKEAFNALLRDHGADVMLGRSATSE
jgi:hypothetical protein